MIPVLVLWKAGARKESNPRVFPLRDTWSFAEAAESPLPVDGLERKDWLMSVTESAAWSNGDQSSTARGVPTPSSPPPTSQAAPSMRPRQLMIPPSALDELEERYAAV